VKRNWQKNILDRVIKAERKIWCGLVTLMMLSSPAISHQFEYDMIVAQDGSGDFTTIQAAIDAAKAYPDAQVLIYIKNGVYKEKVQVYSWNTKLSLIGEDRDKTVITYDDYFDKIGLGRNSTFHTYTLQVRGNDFYAENLTIENSAGPVGQAVALHVEADRTVFVNCRFIGNQDTVFAAGEGTRQYFKDCYIEGTTDYIIGSATAVFDECEIHSKANSYITAASTPEGEAYGFVFLNAHLTASEGVQIVYLGRPWRKHARTVFIKCEMGAFIRPEGWHNWSKPEAEQHAFYAEYGSAGPGANPESRVEWSHQLKGKALKHYSLEKIFKGWKPLNKDD